MPTEITETEIVSTPLQRVTVGSQKLRIPRSPTLKFMFGHGSFIAKLNTGEVVDDDIQDYYDLLTGFLRRYNETLDEDRLQEECELATLVGFYVRWFGDQGDGEPDEGDERPPRPRRSGTATKSGRSRNASR